MALVEVCVDSVASAESARRAGADRVELCVALGEGGLTPTGGLIASCVERCGLPVHVLVRPRGGDFVYSDVEMEVMRRDVALAKSAGAAGIVSGVLTPGGRIDTDRTSVLVDRAAPLGVTFHRAFDLTRDLDEALDDLIALGVVRVLTSGGEATAVDGTAALKSLVESASDRLIVMAGGGIREHNVERVVTQTGVTEIHTRCSVVRPGHRSHDSAVRLRSAPLAEHAVEVTDADALSRLVRLVRG